MKIPYQNIHIFILTLFGLLLTLPVVSFAYPEGQLYWQVDNYPEASISNYYADSLTYNGALFSLDYSCRQYSGSSGSYSGQIHIDSSANNYSAQKGGWCRNNTFIGLMDGAYYTTYLYCNGVKRDMFDDSPCIAENPIQLENNFGNCGG